MNSALVFFTFLGLLSTAIAATSSGYYGDPEFPGKCVISPDIIVPPGTHNSPVGCARIECSESGYAHIATCGVQGAGTGCTLGDYKEPYANYPDCCIRETICTI